MSELGEQVKNDGHFPAKHTHLKDWAIQEDMYRGLAVPFPVLANSIKRAWQLAKVTCLGFEKPVFHPALNNPDYTIYSKRKKASLTCWISVRYLAVLSDILGSLVVTRLEFDLLRHGASCKFDPASPMFNYHEQLAHYCSTSSSLRLALVAVRRECCS